MGKSGIITLGSLFLLWMLPACVSKSNPSSVSELQRLYPVSLVSCAQYYFNAHPVCIALALTREEADDPLSSTKLMKDEYVTRIFQNWRVEDALLSSDEVFQSIVRLTILKDGDLARFETIRASQSKDFNASVETAVTQSIPFLQFDAEIDQAELIVVLSFYNKKM